MDLHPWKQILATARKETPADVEFSFYFNKAQNFLDLAENILDARIAAAKGDHAQAISYWERAVEVQDKLYYGEPPEWFYPVRESLGSALLLSGQPERAEAVFRADLEQYPLNPRSLYKRVRLHRNLLGLGRVYHWQLRPINERKDTCLEAFGGHGNNFNAEDSPTSKFRI